MKGLFVVGTDTGVGKTVVSAALLAASSPDVVYWKPVQTGYPEDDDTATVRVLTGLSASRTLEVGERFRAACSPHHAARLEGRSLHVEDVLRIAREQGARTRRWIVEGAGGLLVPLNDRETMADVVRALRLPVLVVASTRLGTINHTLLTVRVLESLGVAVVGVVLTGADDESARTGIAAHAPGLPLAHVPVLELDEDSVLAAGERLLETPSIRKALA